MAPWKKQFMKKKKDWEDKQVLGLLGASTHAAKDDSMEQNDKLS